MRQVVERVLRVEKRYTRTSSFPISTKMMILVTCTQVNAIFSSPCDVIVMYSCFKINIL